MAKFGVNQAGSGQSILNWIVSQWFILVTSFVQKHFVAQDKTLSELVKIPGAEFFDIHVRYWKKKLYVSNGLFLFNLTLKQAVDILHSRPTPFRFRIVYDDLLPNSIWKFKFFRKVEAIDKNVTDKIAKIIEDWGYAKNIVSITLSSNDSLGIYFNEAIKYHYPERFYKTGEWDEFHDWLARTPQGENDIIIAAPNDTISLSKFVEHLPSIADSSLFRDKIVNWIGTQPVTNKATYLINHV